MINTNSIYIYYISILNFNDLAKNKMIKTIVRTLTHNINQ